MFFVDKNFLWQRKIVLEINNDCLVKRKTKLGLSWTTLNFLVVFTFGPIRLKLQVPNGKVMNFKKKWLEDCFDKMWKEFENLLRQLAQLLNFLRC